MTNYFKFSCRLTIALVVLLLFPMLAFGNIFPRPLWDVVVILSAANALVACVLFMVRVSGYTKFRS